MTACICEMYFIHLKSLHASVNERFNKIHQIAKAGCITFLTFSARIYLLIKQMGFLKEITLIFPLTEFYSNVDLRCLAQEQFL